MECVELDSGDVLGDELTYERKTYEYTQHQGHPGLVCQICSEFFQHPVELSCGHAFCYLCVKQLDLCPLCHTRITHPLQFVVSGYILKQLFELEGKNHICRFSCPVLIFKQHLRRSIMHSISSLHGLMVIFNKAEKSVKMVFLNRCPNPNCQVVCYRGLLEQHLPLCPTECPLGCKEQVAPASQSEHEHHCKEKLVFCSAAYAKCPWVGPRRELPTHEEMCVFVQLIPQFQYIQEQIHQFAVERRKVNLVLEPEKVDESETPITKPAVKKQRRLFGIDTWRSRMHSWRSDFGSTLRFVFSFWKSLLAIACLIFCFKLSARFGMLLSIPLFSFFLARYLRMRYIERNVSQYVNGVTLLQPQFVDKIDELQQLHSCFSKHLGQTAEWICPCEKRVVLNGKQHLLSMVERLGTLSNNLAVLGTGLEAATATFREERMYCGES